MSRNVRLPMYYNLNENPPNFREHLVNNNNGTGVNLSRGGPVEVVVHGNGEEEGVYVNNVEPGPGTNSPPNNSNNNVLNVNNDPNMFKPRANYNNRPNRNIPIRRPANNSAPNKPVRIRFSNTVRERPIKPVGLSNPLNNRKTGLPIHKTRTKRRYQGNPMPFQSSTGLVNSAVSRAMGLLATNSTSLNAAKAKVKPDLLNVILAEQGTPKNLRKFTVTRHFPEFERKLLRKLNRSFNNMRNNA